MSGCHIHDNTATTMFSSASTARAAFLSNRVEYNTFYTAFALFGVPATVDGCSFHRNFIPSWYAEGYDEPTLYAQSVEGEGLEPEDLAAMEIRPVQFREDPIEPSRWRGRPSPWRTRPTTGRAWPGTTGGKNATTGPSW